MVLQQALQMLVRIATNISDRDACILGFGAEVEFECEITKADVLSAAEPYIRRSVEICQKVLAEQKVDRSAVERVILVGGPTLAPYFRELLTKGLGIRLDHRVDVRMQTLAAVDDSAGRVADDRTGRQSDVRAARTRRHPRPA